MSYLIFTWDTQLFWALYKRVIGYRDETEFFIYGSGLKLELKLTITNNTRHQENPQI